MAFGAKANTPQFFAPAGILWIRRGTIIQPADRKCSGQPRIRCLAE